MMRYSFQDFLNYQDELNEKYDEEKVKCMIDGILVKLRTRIEQCPTTHTHIVYNNICDGDICCYDILNCSLTELQAISDYFEDMGFTVEWLHIQEDDNAAIVGFQMNW